MSAAPVQLVPSEAVVELSAMTVAEEQALREQMRRYREALENIMQRTVADVNALPIGRAAPNGCFLGSLLFIEGLCQAGLAE